MTHKSPITVLVLSLVTLGIYFIVWTVKAKGEMAAKGADIPTSWLLLIPIANIWYLWKLSEGVEKVTKKDLSGPVAFLFVLLLGPIGAFVIQSKFNSIA